MKKVILSFAVLVFISASAVAQMHTEYYSNGKKQSEGAYDASANTVTKVVYASDGSTRPDPSQPKLESGHIGMTMENLVLKNIIKEAPQPEYGKHGILQVCKVQK